MTLIISFIALSSWYQASLYLDIASNRKDYWKRFNKVETLLEEGIKLAKNGVKCASLDNGSLSIETIGRKSLIKASLEGCLVSCVFIKNHNHYVIEDYTISTTL